MVGCDWGNERGSGFTHNTVGIQTLLNDPALSTITALSHPGILVGFRNDAR